MATSVVPANRIEFEAFARLCDLHPEFLSQLVALGLVDMTVDAAGRRWFHRSQVAVVARILRLRSGLRISYSAIAVVAPLIDRIDELEAELRRVEAEQHAPQHRWDPVRVNPVRMGKDNT
jgi:DNA-binding transcriptional MerR regulator